MSTTVRGTRTDTTVFSPYRSFPGSQGQHLEGQLPSRGVMSLAMVGRFTTPHGASLTRNSFRVTMRDFSASSRTTHGFGNQCAVYVRARRHRLSVKRRPNAVHFQLYNVRHVRYLFGTVRAPAVEMYSPIERQFSHLTCNHYRVSFQGRHLNSTAHSVLAVNYRIVQDSCSSTGLRIPLSGAFHRPRSIRPIRRRVTGGSIQLPQVRRAAFRNGAKVVHGP